MHAQPGVGISPDTPVAAGARADRQSGPIAPGEDASAAPDADRPEWGYLPATSFRSRRSALSDAQRDAWGLLWPQPGWRQAGAPALRGPLDIHAWFGRTAPVVLEIGSGSGTST